MPRLTILSVSCHFGLFPRNLVEGECHDPVGEIKCLLDAVAVVDIDVNVQDSWVDLQRIKGAGSSAGTLAVDLTYCTSGSQIKGIVS